MITGLSSQDLAKQIMEQRLLKKDYIARNNMVRMTTVPDSANCGMLKPRLSIESIGSFVIGDVAHEQIAEKLKIPRKYYDKMLVEAPELLSDNVNHWLHRIGNEPRLYRTMGERVRAVLSDKYRPIDNYFVANTALAVLSEDPRLEIKSSAITESRMYIQAVTPRLQGEIRQGQPIFAGVVISNSEIGKGRLSVESLLYFLRCKNGAIGSLSLKKYHTGRRIDGDDYELANYFSSETVQAENEAFSLKVRDTVRECLSATRFEMELEAIRESAERKLPAESVVEAVKEVTEKYTLSVAEGDDILARLIGGADLTQYGLANAVTNYANDCQDYDRVVELERVGGSLFALSDSEWKTIAKL